VSSRALDSAVDGESPDVHSAMALGPESEPDSTVTLGHPSGLTADGKLKSGRLAGLSMSRAIWILAWPILIESVLGSLVGATDTYVAAQLSEAATDAIGGASYLLWFIGLVLMAIGVGATAMISRAVGAGRLAVARAAVGQTLLIALVLGAFAGGVIAVSASSVASIMHLNDEAMGFFTRYCRLLSFGVPFMAILSSMIACLRGAGDSYRPLRAMVVVNIVNIFATWLLSGVDLKTASVVDGVTITRTLLYNPLPFNLGVTGIAVGTVIAEGIGALLILRSISVGTGGVRLTLRRLKPHTITLVRLIRVGIPNFMETFGMWIGNFAVILLVGKLGTGAGGVLGSHIVAIRIESFSFQPGFALGIAAGALAGQYLGARSPAHARRAILICTGLASISMGLTGVLLLLFPTQITGLISSQHTHLQIVPPTLMVAGAVQLPFAVGLVMRGALRGAGDVKWTMYITWLMTYGVRLPLVYFASGVDLTMPAWLSGETIVNPCKFGGTLSWVWAALSFEVAVRGVAFGWRFLNGGWAKVRV
jgi:putative MATE family efflux protein